MNSNRKLVDGFRIKGFLDWAFVMLSFLVFLALEGAMVYAFFVFVNKL
jgi:cytochrome c oxidase subunit IV